MLKRRKEIFIGQLEAEAEIDIRATVKLEDVFYDLIDIEGFFEKSNKYLLVGGKGSGKSAFARVYQNRSKSYNKFCSIITKSAFDFESVIQELPKDSVLDNSNRNLQKHLIEWLILNRILEMFMNNEFIKTLKEYNKLLAFQQINRGIISANDREVIESIRQFEGSVNVDPLNSFIKANWGKNVTFKFKKAFFAKVIPDLKNIIKIFADSLSEYSQNTNYYFTLIIDDLDHDLKNESNHRDFLMDMIRCVKDYNIGFLQSSNVFLKVTLLLRPDILSELHSYSDSFKLIESYKEYINWFNVDYERNMEEDSHVRQLVNYRLAKVLNEFDKRNISKDPWYDLVDKSADRIEKSSFKWCLDKTRYRPRDIILLVNKLLVNVKRNDKIYSEQIKTSFSSYSKGLWSDIKNELSFYFSYDDLNKLENVLQKATYSFDLQKLESVIKNENFNLYTAERLIEILFNNSVIGNCINGKYYWKHRELEEPTKINYGAEFLINLGLKENFYFYE